MQSTTYRILTQVASTVLHILKGGGGRDLLRRRREWRGLRAEPLTPPLIMGRQDGGFGGHPVVGVEGQVCEEATEDLQNVWKFFECSEFWNRDFVWVKVKVFCAHQLSNMI